MAALIACGVTVVLILAGVATLEWLARHDRLW